METHSPAVEHWAFAVMLIGLPIGFFLFFKSFRAQTRKAYWSYNGLIAAVMLAMFGLLTTAGLIPSTEHLRQQQAEAPPAHEILSNFPTSNLVLFGLVAVIWIGGGNWIIIRQNRKAGRPWWYSFNPFNPPFRYMDGKSWVQLILLAFLSLAVFSIGANLIERSPQHAGSEMSEN